MECRLDFGRRRVILSLMKIAFLMALCATPALAQDCPPAPDFDAEKAEIYREMRIARDETDARILSDSLWRMWLQAPDEQAQALLDQGMDQRNVADYLGARQTLGRLIDYCPDYAEGYNQRAFASFLAGDYAAALTDLEEALARDPRHLGALTGKALTQMGLGEDDAAQATLREALRLNPWLAERHLLTGPPEQEL